MIETLLFILDVLLGVALGYAIRAQQDQRKCRDCWDDFYNSAWTLEMDGYNLKLIPIYEYTRSNDGQNE